MFIAKHGIIIIVFTVGLLRIQNQKFLLQTRVQGICASVQLQESGINLTQGSICSQIMNCAYKPFNNKYTDEAFCKMLV